jgi:hypothetical protein
MTGIFQELEKELDKIETVAIACEQTATSLKDIMSKYSNEIIYILEV